MSEGAHVTGPRVQDARGPVHAGYGDQHINMLLAAGIDSGRTGPDPRQVTEDGLTRRAQRFVPPGGFAQARETLSKRHMVLVTGEPGSGRRCAALMLLHELKQRTGSFHELLDQSEEGNGRGLDPDHVGDQDRLLLDLLSMDEGRRHTVLSELDSFLETVRRHGAHLTVVIPTDRNLPLAPEFHSLAVAIQPPDGREVLLRHLLHESIRPSASELASHELSRFLRRESLERVGTLAVRIGQARQRDVSGERFHDWLAAALKALVPSAPEVAGHLRQEGDGRRRALLLTAAFLHSARQEVVDRAAEELLQMTGHPEEGTPLLAREPLATRLSTIGATADGAGRVTLGELGFDRTVRTHSWNNFPVMRETLRDWTAHVAPAPWLDTTERSSLVTHFTEQWLRTEPPEGLRQLTEKWTKTGPWRGGRSAASQLLRDAILHERHGSWFRRTLYEWSRATDLQQGLAHVVIGACTTDMLTHYPDQSMVRLRHLARHQSPSVRGDARVALTYVTRDDDRLYRRLLERLRLDSPRHGPADTALFLHIADPLRLVTSASRTRPPIASPALREQLATHWAAAWRHADRTQWRDRLKSWLDTARQGTAPGGLLLDVLIAGCESDVTALGRLHVVARDWRAHAPAQEHDMRARTVARLRSRSRAALGLRQRIHSS